MSDATIATRIVEFYRASHRPLPWRSTRDPYAIWISEIMCQQTRVDTVIPYYKRWLEVFPTISALAESNVDDVLAAWSGLGYYSRARNLRKGASDVVARYNGALPDTADELQSIPGIGRYTAGAIASIAFGQKTPVVDGNVARVLARVYAMHTDVKSSRGQNTLWQLAAALVPASAPSDFNQGLMELGATVCTPKSPKCAECPVSNLCRARATSTQSTYPITPPRKRRADKLLLERAALWATLGDRVLFARRKPQGLYAGLWELPQAPILSELTSQLGRPVDVPVTAPVFVRKQELSHRRLHIEVWTGTVQGRAGVLPPSSEYDRTRWMPLADAMEHGVSSATRAILDRYRSHGWINNSKQSNFSKKATKRSSKV